MPTAEIYIQSLGFTVAYTGDVYAHTLLTGGIGAGAYLGPMGPLTSHAINDNGAPTPTPAWGYTSFEGDYGSIDIQGITFTQLSGWMEIAPH